MDDSNENLQYKDTYLKINGKKFKTHVYFWYKDQDGNKDKKRGLQRYTVFAWLITDDLSDDKVILGSFLERFMHINKINIDMQIKYNVLRPVTSKLSGRRNEFLRHQMFTNKTHFESLLENKDPDGRLYEFIGYKWNELKDVPLWIKPKYMFFMKSSTKEKVVFSIFGLILGIIGTVVSKHFL